jgi:hypothetical protein
MNDARAWIVRLGDVELNPLAARVRPKALSARLDATCTAKPGADGTIKRGPNACIFRDELDRTIQDTKPELR